MPWECGSSEKDAQDSFTVVRGFALPYFAVTNRPVTALRLLPVEPPPLVSLTVVRG
jgi:hypothetical protein